MLPAQVLIYQMLPPVSDGDQTSNHWQIQKHISSKKSVPGEILSICNTEYCVTCIAVVRASSTTLTAC
eukprot:14016678-Ditylum_brightwellii.AAC.1